MQIDFVESLLSTLVYYWVNINIIWTSQQQMHLLLTLKYTSKNEYEIEAILIKVTTAYLARIK